MQTVLVVDDEPNNVRLLQLDLEEHYHVLTAVDGVHGWEMLQKHKADISAILLDRMMPNMDGMAFMKKLCADESVARIPVIMQTAAAEKTQVAEGVRAGVYYYLTKPYDHEVMLAIVDAAVRDYGDYSQMRQDLRLYKQKIHIVRDCSFEVATIAEARYLATFLANFFPEPERVIFGISELVINAIEHGNLGITYEEKTTLNKTGTWEEELQRRQELPEYKGRKARVNYMQHEDHISLHIQDEGEGFAWEEYMDISPERLTHSHGRGIALSRMMSFDAIDYQGNGNAVMCRVNMA